jgi:hypothetical protein
MKAAGQNHANPQGQRVNDAQTLFALFFAILWGGILSVQGRWLAFHPAVNYGHIARRWILSITVLNVGPVVYFAVAYLCLQPGTDTFRLVVGAVLPAFAIFGFYRLWQSIVQAAPACFYKRSSEMPKGLQGGGDRTLEELHLEHQLGGWNLLSAVFYFGVAAVGLSLR